MTRARETSMRRVLMVSAHFPPDTSAATHRVRLLAPHLVRYGWEPTVVSVDARDYEGRLDAGLANLVPLDLRVVRCRAWPARLTRAFGVGDLGLRAFSGLFKATSDLLRRESFDALFITIHPTYPALLGPILKRRFGVPFVLDYQDPWIGAWGASVGGGPGGRPDAKSRLSRFVATRLEPRAVRAADAIVAVSGETYEEVRRRHPAIERTPFAAIPVGGEPADFDRLRCRPRPNPFFDPADGRVHLCSVGTLLPLGRETLRAVLGAVALLRTRRPDVYDRLSLHFIGTSNQSPSPMTSRAGRRRAMAGNLPARALPLARELRVADRVSEIAPRVEYLDALSAQVQAGGILMMGSSERHYTASKLYPALLARRPILAVFHRESSVVEILGRTARRPAARVVTYDDAIRAESRVEAIYEELSALVRNPTYDPHAVDHDALADYSARSLAGRLARVLDQAAAAR